MSRYLVGFVLAALTLPGIWNTTQAYAGDGAVVIMREVPYQSWNEPRHTGQVLAVGVAPDQGLVSMTGNGSLGKGNAVTELTDLESAVIASGNGSTGSLLNSGLQNSAAYEGISAGHATGTLSSALSPTGPVGSAISGIGGGAGGTVRRATESLTNTLNGAMSHAGGM